MMFKIGDIITGTPENECGITTRGVLCEVVDISDDSSFVQVKVTGVDYDQIKEGRSWYAKHLAEIGRFSSCFYDYIGREYEVGTDQFELYELHADALTDFINGV